MPVGRYCPQAAARGHPTGPPAVVAAAALAWAALGWACGVVSALRAGWGCLQWYRPGTGSLRVPGCIFQTAYTPCRCVLVWG